MPEQWQIPVIRLPRYRLPVVVVRFSGSLEGTMIVASTEPSTYIVEDVVDHFGFALTMDRVAAAPRGRRVVPAYAGMLLAPIFRLRDLELQTADGGWLALGPLTVTVTNRPRVLGVGGLLGVDLLARFRRVQFELGPPDRMIPERDE